MSEASWKEGEGEVGGGEEGLCGERRPAMAECSASVIDTKPGTVA